MSKLLQIEQALLRLDQSTFQKICAAYLSFEYEGFDVKEVGGSHGQNTTTTGTPDILIDCRNGKYYFVECTIQKKDRKNKFLGDISNCFDTGKTSIAVKDIELIILCHNTKGMSPADRQSLDQAAKQHGCTLYFVDIDTLKFVLYKKYPKLAMDFLGVEVDTQQILLLPDFIKEQERKSTSLQNKFIGREKEVKDIVSQLMANNLIVLYGGTGIGKTRLGLEALTQLRDAEPEYEIYGIDNKGVSLWNDLQTFFLPGHKYLLLIDDANRLAEFQQLARLSISEGFETKAIVTVRDYALEKVKGILKENKFNYIGFQVEKLTEETVKEILTSQNITNPLCVENIIRIADGNPRLVMMAASFVLDADDCSRLSNVVDIYDEYFGRTLREISGLNDEDTLKTLGIISFFRIINKDQRELNEQIYEVFGIEENSFWECIYRLHELELVDLYEKEVVKIVDQTIATYFFYYVFIKKQLLDYSSILSHFLDDYPGKVKESLYPILKYFGYDTVMEAIGKAVDAKLQSSMHDNQAFIKFMEIFWFCRKEELLVWLQEQVQSVSAGSEDIKTRAEKDFFPKDRDSHIELLKLFGSDFDEFFKYSFEILFEYAQKKPGVLSEVQKYFTSDISFKKNSHRQGYRKQIYLFDFLLAKAESGKDTQLAVNILLSICGHFLQLWFENVHSGGSGKNSFAISQIHLTNHDQIVILRERIWGFLLAQYPSQPEQVTEILSKYINNSYPSIFRHEERGNPNEHTTQLRVLDEPFLQRFFSEVFDGTSLLQCELFHSHLENLTKSGVDASPYNGLEEKFSTYAYRVAKSLEWNYRARIRGDIKITWEEFHGIKEAELIQEFSSDKLLDYIHLIDAIEEVLYYHPDAKLGLNSRFQSLDIVLTELAHRNMDICLEVLEHVFSKGNTLKYTSGTLMGEVVPIEQRKIYRLINKYDFLSKSLWGLHYFQFLPSAIISEATVEELLKLYHNVQTDLLLNFEFLDRYKKIDEAILVKAIRVLMARTGAEFNFRLNEYGFFRRHLEDFKEDIEALKELYYYVDSTDPHHDLEADSFIAILSMDKNFLVEYINKFHDNRWWRSPSDTQIGFDKLWELENNNELIDLVIGCFTVNDFSSYSEHYINAFFPKGEIREEVKNYIFNFIKQHPTNIARMKAIFNVVTHTYSDTRILFLDELLTFTTDVELLGNLDLFNPDKSGSQSLVNVYNEEKKFWEAVEGICTKDLKRISVKLWAKKQQKQCDQNIALETKRNFSDDY